MEHQALGIMSIIPYGDRAALIRFEAQVNALTRQRVRATQRTLEQAGVPGMLAYIPAHTSLTVCFDPTLLSFPALVQTIRSLPLPSAIIEDVHTTWHIPVCYGGNFGPDLETVAAFHKMTATEMIAIHSQQRYEVYLLGFMAGFAYLGPVPTPLPTPRRQTPRVQIPVGSVAIADRQTCIYPSESAGGWQVIGRTPIRLINEHLQPPIMWQVGDRVQFFPIESREWDDWHTKAGLATDWEWLTDN